MRDEHRVFRASRKEVSRKYSSPKNFQRESDSVEFKEGFYKILKL